MATKPKQVKSQFNNAALVIIDVQAKYCDPKGYRGNDRTLRVAKKIQKLAPEFRKAGLPIYAVYFGPNHATPEQINFFKFKPEKSDQVIAKQTQSAFKTKNFDLGSHEKEIQKLYICGVNFNACVADTAVDANKIGFDVTVLSDLSANDQWCAETEADDRHYREVNTERMQSVGIKFQNSKALLK